MNESELSDNRQIPLLKPAQELRNLKLSTKSRQAQRLIRRYAFIAGGLGAFPLSRLAGQAVVATTLLKLLNDLCRLYDVRFSDQQNKILIASILGGAHYHWIGGYLTKLVTGCRPLMRSPAAALLLHPAIAGTLVYYIGRLFLVHLESGVWHAAMTKPHKA